MGSMSIFDVDVMNVPDLGKIRFEQGASREKFEILFEKSEQAFMQEWAEDDERVRFCQPAIGAERFAQNPANIMLTAVTEANDIAGVAMCRKTASEVGGASFEMMARVYDGYRGYRIGSQLVRLIHDTSDAAMPKATYFTTRAMNQKGFEIGVDHGYALVDDTDCMRIPTEGMIALARSIKISRNRSKILQ